MQEFPGVVSLLRFLRRSGRLGEVDKFASAPDADSAVEVLREAMSLVYRSRRGAYCHEEEIKAEEAEKYRYLCGRGCVVVEGGKHILRVRCPKLPSEEELRRLHDELRAGRLKPSYLAALALARGRGP